MAVIVKKFSFKQKPFCQWHEEFEMLVGNEAATVSNNMLLTEKGCVDRGDICNDKNNPLPRQWWNTTPKQFLKRINCLFMETNYELILWECNCKNKEQLVDNADLTDCYCTGQEMRFRKDTS